MIKLKPGQTEEDAVIAYLVSLGAREATDEERRTERYARGWRDTLRIWASDDTSIPAPDEDAELRAMGIDPTIIRD
jgi:hypothetical protein